jgi:chemotaxis protein methyltransferase CheR
LTERQFDEISRLVHEQCGIALRGGKELLVKARLAKRLRALGMADFAEYIALVQQKGSGGELASMIDALTTNKTSFFRESQHFDYLSDTVIPELVASDSRIRIWCAGCSTGEEPFSIAMTLREYLPGVARRDVRILATDISPTALAKARRAVYNREMLRGVPEAFVTKYFTRLRDEPADAYRVKDEVRLMVRLAELNLMHQWPMQGPFDIIFCRNVMIYFERITRETLVNRFAHLLRPGGRLFVGHAESLTGLAHPFAYAQPAVYVR